MHVDFTERELYNDLYPHATDTRAFTTHTDYSTVVRVLDGTQGLYVSLESGVAIAPLIDDLSAIIRD
ncbi:hypothetical protein [Natronoarchaeum rubrum]|uniref:hypothetical protein n=1 Tax=Natronoarchaeum rubrum TaxID=755311 RepID=UPI0021117389|nr:hypothetical protein [Natronoarchaeum rubrum]